MDITGFLGRSCSLGWCCLISTFKTRSGANGKHSFLGLHLHSFSHWPHVLTWSLLELCWNPCMVGPPESCAPRMSWMFYAMGMTKQSDACITSVSSAHTRAPLFCQTSLTKHTDSQIRRLRIPVWPQESINVQALWGAGPWVIVQAAVARKLALTIVIFVILMTGSCCHPSRSFLFWVSSPPYL